MGSNSFGGYDEKHARMVEAFKAAEERMLAEASTRKKELEDCECKEGMFPSPSRRQMMLGVATAGVAALMPRMAVAAAPPGAREWPVQRDPTREQGRLTFEDGGYGMRSQFEIEVRWLLPTPTRESSATMTPLAQGQGIITPSGLHFERHHGGIPNIDPKRHVLYVHGMVEKPMKFSVDELKRLPSVSKIMFVECSGNSFTEWEKPRLKTVQGTHGLTSTSEWTGVPVSTILSMCGIKGGAAWVMAEGADAAVMNRSIPVDKMMDDAFIAYGQNGEAIRPEQGYPLRLFLPGYEGNTHIKWLRRLVVSDKPFMTREETSKYTDLLQSGKAVQFSFVMEAKSVITFPSGEMKLPGPGFYEITGLAWSGRAKIKRVEISIDGGKGWSLASLQDPVLPMCHTRFRFPWYWDGQPAVLQSRATDETGYVQPTIKQLIDVRGLSRPGIGQFYHMNGIQSWAVAADGSVSNVHVY
jgi:sulfane dehydrogenase subunit SoxC